MFRAASHHHDDLARVRAASPRGVRRRQRRAEDGGRAEHRGVAALAGAGGLEPALLQDAPGAHGAQGPRTPGAARLADGSSLGAMALGGYGEPAADIAVVAALALDGTLAEAQGALAADVRAGAAVARILAVAVEAVGVLPPGGVGLHGPASHNLSLVQAADVAEEGHVPQGIAEVPVLQAVGLLRASDAVQRQRRHAALLARRGRPTLLARLAGTKCLIGHIAHGDVGEGQELLGSGLVGYVRRHVVLARDAVGCDARRDVR
mmetsp:Transcript_48186/g.97290  ORF Transcript_48186/g.97290 Transcript_48186/m.97290 type:complete len:263 (-) Transcript_48186:652-1440(-)